MSAVGSTLTTSKFAEKFAQNWKERSVQEDTTAEEEGQLDDSLTSLQWLHNITILDITPPGQTASSPASSPRSSSTTDEDGDTASDKSDPCVVKLKETKLVDYASDPHRKPPYSYATLICMAMRDTKKTKITLSAIYKWIRENFVYYRHADPTWQNSIRHNLSLNKCFMKVARRKDEPGKGGFWKIDPAYADMFVDGVFKRRRSSSKAPRKTTPSNKSTRSKSTSYLPWNTGRPSLTDRHSVSSDVSDTSYIEEEIPPYSGGLKQDLSWNSLLPDTESDFSFREAVDAQDIIIDHNYRVLNSPFVSFPTTNPPPYYDGGGDVFVHDGNLDLTIRGVGLMPASSQRTSPLPARINHPWAEEPPVDIMASLDFFVSQEMGQCM